MTTEMEYEALRPKALAYDRLMGSTQGAMGVRAAAKVLGVGERELVKLLLKLKWLYRAGGKRLTAHHEATRAGLVESMAVEVQREGGAQLFSQARLTPAGIAELSRMLLAG